jgi:hypothetical protein
MHSFSIDILCRKLLLAHFARDADTKKICANI